MVTSTAVVLLWITAVACSEPDAPRTDAVARDVAADTAMEDVGSDVGLDVADVRVVDLAFDAAVADVRGDMAADAADVGPDLTPCVPSGDEPEPFTDLPDKLSDTGLYDDISQKSISAGVRTFEPQYPLWSDGAVKTRWVWLPECAAIDTSDPDHWEIPVGTKLWKQFVVDGTVVETRLIHRYGPGPDDFLFGAYLWEDDESEAFFVPSGERDARGTSHDVPNTQACEGCHTRLPERILGFSAIQLDHDGSGITLDNLTAEDRLTDDVPETLGVPGDATARAALGYLHGNCGNCHNDSADALQLPNRALSLRVSVHDTAVSDTGAQRTAVDVDVDRFSHPSCSLRIDPGSASTSCLVLRMQLRGRPEQMPPLGTETPDPTGIQVVSDWIESL